MRLLVLFCCLWLLPGVASAAPAVGEIRVVSETWTRYTQEDGRGVAWDLLRAVYEPAGVRLRIANEPYTRAVGLVLRGEADAWVGAYRGEIDEALYPRWPYDVDPIAVLSLKDNPPPPLEGLSRFRLSWMRGYAFARYFPTLTPHSELQRRTSALPMLLNHRVDYFIDSRPELEEMLAGAGALAAGTASPTSLGCRCILASPIPPGAVSCWRCSTGACGSCMPAASWSGSSPAGTGPMRR